jgi:L,D-transpeptidase-like protein/putative peptidoglycan binding protein
MNYLSQSVRAAAILLVSLTVPAAFAVDSVAPQAPVTLRLSTQKVAVFGQRIVLRGHMAPSTRGARVRISVRGTVVAHAKVGPRGGFKAVVRLRSRGPYRAGWYEAVSPKVFVTVRPRLEASLVGGRVVGTPLRLYAQLRPRGAGAIRVEVFRNGKRTLAAGYRGSASVKLGTSSFGEVRVRLRVVERPGFAPARSKVLRAKLLAPELRYGATGPGVTELVRRLGALRYAVRTTTVFGAELLDSVIAFQKVQGLERDGAVAPNVWKRLANPRIPSPRYAAPADHLEVDKTRQVLFVVRGGSIATIVPVSTAGIPGWSTPEGTFAIYRKVGGFDSSPLGTLYLPMYFHGGYAIHGNPSVPPYPASHGCIRVPMWIADWLYATNGYGETVYIYS